MKKICYISGSSIEYGFGHIRRSLALAEELKRYYKVFFYVYTKNVKIKSLNLGKRTYIDRPFKDIPCDLIVLDLPEKMYKEAIDHYKREMNNIPLLALGYYSLSKRKPDIVINLDENKEFRRKHKVGYYSGLKYAIIRKEFFKYKLLPERPNSNFKNILISLGGADSYNLSAKIISSLEELNYDNIKVKLHLILGPLIPNERKKILMNYRKLNLKIYDMPKGLEKLMANADIAICNGGTMMLEYAFLGVPIIAIPQTDLEKKFIVKFESKGVAIFIGVEEIKKKLPLMLTALVKNQYLSNRMRLLGKVLIDGDGGKRIVNIISKFLKK